MDSGKPIRESRDVDVPLAAAHFFYYAGWADKLEYAGFGPDPKPLGVAGQVIPWNFPLLMAAWKIAPALACGNTVVLKPAETTPLTALILAEIIAEADLPAGRREHRHRRPGDGQAIVEHAGLDKIAFTGSTEVGKIIQRTLAGTGRRLTLELGGKAANIVFDDAPLDQAVEGIVNGIFFNQGQVCCAGSRLFVQESIEDELIACAQAPAGDAARRRSARQEHRHRRDQLRRATRSHPRALRLGEDEGAKRGRRRATLPDRGYWFAPTLFTGVSQANRIAQEEIFGPVLSVLTFRTPDEAIEKANNTPYGLSAGVWTDKGSRILSMANQLRAGVMWANTFNRFDPASPFGGYKESGFGREGGRHGWRHISMSDRLAVRKTYKLYIGGAFPRSESGRSYPVTQRRATCSRTPRRPRARTCAMRSSPRARHSAAGRRRPHTTAGRSSTASPRCSRDAARSSSTRSRRPRAARRSRR